MANPNINTLTDIFLPDGFGAFGFGEGVYGGGSELINPQWNTNSGNFGIDPVTGLPYIEATSTPSYVGASLYTIEYSSFFAKIVPAAVGGGSVQTALVIKSNAHNYVEMSVGPEGLFKGYVSNDLEVTLPDSSFPAYDPSAHAFWRIRNEDKLNFHFDVSPDGANWTELGSVPYTWDASSVVVTIFAGFTGFDAPGNFALVSNINLPNTTLALSGIARATAAAAGMALVSDPNSLSGRAHAIAGLRAKFLATLGIPEGGLSDFVYVQNARIIDPLMLNQWKQQTFTNFLGASPMTQAAWATASAPFAAPTHYRDGSYWPPAEYAVFKHKVEGVPDNGPNLLTNAQVENTIGLGNRLSLDAYIYATECPYTPGLGAASMTRSTDLALTGQYSGKLTSNGTPIVIGDGTTAYACLPLTEAIVKVRRDGSGNAENMFGNVYLSTTRANTSWFASFIFYDANFNILTASTYRQASITNKNTHPGGGVWQSGNVFATGIPSNAVWAGLVPFVNAAASVVETVHISNHSITGASLDITEVSSGYSNPRTANINIKADRVNYMLNSGFNNSDNQFIAQTTNTTGTPVPIAVAWDGTVGYKSLGSLKVTISAPSGTFTGSAGATLGITSRPNLSSTTSGRFPLIQRLKVGHTYTISAWILPGTNCPDVRMNFYDANDLGPSDIGINDTRTNNPERIDGNWIRVQNTYTIPPEGLQDYALYFYTNFSDIGHAPFSFWVDSIMVEEATDYQGYFDGGFASPDYQWESGGTANLSRSYYYKDYSNKLINLNRVISSVLPVGESYNLQFALPIN